MRQTVEKLKACDAFVVGFDETCINKKEEMEILVKIANPEDGVELRHYKTVELEAGDSESIKSKLLDTFEDDGIDYRKKLGQSARARFGTKPITISTLEVARLVRLARLVRFVRLG